MSRKLTNWMESYLRYTDNTEAPAKMHKWTAVSVLAGAMRRKIWIDMKRFKWFPSLYVILVAPPGVVSKTTTIDLGMELLREVPGIKFGPDIVTWQSVVTTFAASCESFEYNGDWHPMSPITFASGELGNLFNPQDREMVNLFISLWDDRKRLEKTTKTSGNDSVEAPWINMIAATTPHWLADNMPAASVGGGFTSRCVFVYADHKERYIAYPHLYVEEDYDELRQDLIDDLIHISTTLCGPVTFTREAIEWGMDKYKEIWTTRPEALEDAKLDGYIARKQTHLHKIAMVLSIARGDDMMITLEDMTNAEIMLEEMEEDLARVFARIGRSQESLRVEEVFSFIKRRGAVPYEEVYRHIHTHYPDLKNFEGFVAGAIKAGYLAVDVSSGVPKLRWALKGNDKSYGL